MRFVSYLCGACGEQRHVAPSCLTLTAEPALTIDCVWCGSTLIFPITSGQALNVKASRLADAVELGRWMDAIAAVETPADLVGVDRG